jgi:hypothetical protein
MSTPHPHPPTSPSSHPPQLEAEVASPPSKASTSAASPSGVPTVANFAAHSLTDNCRVLADVAEPPNMKRQFDASLSVVLLQVRSM